ncbi:glycogen/starch synthase, ADP-glucose type [Alkaliphilus metalliredigens QYMF]|uniref:Glycogen synthase n=1 Tax=Alkaliphilus metalliredigens (strain QYMF) TaxID=293826 RepID=GLGA_ALKMQ|nr:glycogen synthase GlgA [Alkaliphilus metalliredigens]A6TSC8.1 RecName: Full=Glycogen synthase; AltName: Full=Starch [bacterial glycogen] synthase [Alkaliphilus metalliredigens QYMF]ABR49096.1 glycogen/starch synthase, ADP-glucose type [Alkaliphilus metalliredigens QYMF]
MRVMFAASEATPFSKSGGLGDVIGSLPFYLKKLGVDVSVILPKYQEIPQDLKMKMKWIKSMTVPVGWRNQFCGIEILSYKDIHFYFVDNQYYFNREGFYGHNDDGERFAFFSRSVLEILPHIDCKPDIIHCHDWQTAMISYLLKTQYQHHGFYKNIKTVFTIHNLKYQGVFPQEVLGDLFNGSQQHFNEGGVEYHGNVNYMKGGLNFSDYITTVSPTYAQEIQDPFFGEGLEGVLSRKKKQLQGVTNGIDDSVYNPQTDIHLFKNFSSENLRNKKDNKLGLQERLNLAVDAKIPMIGMVTRLVEQKGLDLVANQLEKLMEEEIQLVVLGTGDHQYEEIFRQAAIKYPERISTNLFFDEVLAQQIYGGSDFFLMPSLFEPCGLGQLIALRYGTVPIVRETGGLKDTIQYYDEVSKEGNGFTFTNYNAHDMFNTIKEAIRLYPDKRKFNKVVRNAMNTKVGWEESAKTYLKLYRSLG